MVVVESPKCWQAASVASCDEEQVIKWKVGDSGTRWWLKVVHKGNQMVQVEMIGLKLLQAFHCSHATLGDVSVQQAGCSIMTFSNWEVNFLSWATTTYNATGIDGFDAACFKLPPPSEGSPDVKIMLSICACWSQMMWLRVDGDEWVMWVWCVGHYHNWCGLPQNLRCGLLMWFTDRGTTLESMCHTYRGIWSSECMSPLDPRGHHGEHGILMWKALVGEYACSFIILIFC